MSYEPVKDSLLEWGEKFKEKDVISKVRKRNLKSIILQMKRSGLSTSAILNKLKIHYKEEDIFKALKELGEI